LIPRLEERVRETAAELSEMAAQLEELGVFPNLPGFEQALARFMDSMPAYEALPATILHLDSAPGNVGLPLNGAHSAIIVDWEMASWGLPEIDLAYIFVQPYDNARHLQRETVLAHYWSRHDELGRVAPPPDTQRARLRYAEQLWALWLIPAARRVALEPFTPGTAPAIHWEHMFPRLGRRLLYFVQGK
jgi:thiamine kinase-like enzyme